MVPVGTGLFTCGLETTKLDQTIRVQYHTKLNGKMKKDEPKRKMASTTTRAKSFITLCLALLLSLSSNPVTASRRLFRVYTTNEGECVTAPDTFTGYAPYFFEPTECTIGRYVPSPVSFKVTCNTGGYTVYENLDCNVAGKLGQVPIGCTTGNGVTSDARCIDGDFYFIRELFNGDCPGEIITDEEHTTVMTTDILDGVNCRKLWYGNSTSGSTVILTYSGQITSINGQELTISLSLIHI